MRCKRCSIAMRAAACAVLILIGTSRLSADLTVYTDASDFSDDLAGLGLTSQVLNFESVAAGSTFSAPSTIGSVSFSNYSTDLIVTDLFAATSGSNYLGVASTPFANQFIGGFEFDMQFSSTNAIGFFIVTGETPGFSLFDNDIRIDVAGVGSVSLNVDDLQGVIGGSDNVFFIGLIESSGQFTQAQVRYDMAAINAISFNIDDITTSGFPLGDVNRDGVVNLLDVNPFVALLGSGGFQVEADINRDGVVNLLDIAPFVDILAN